MKTQLFLYLLLLVGGTASAQITINITNPTTYKLSGHNLFVQAKVTSTYEVTSMVASTSGRQGNLSYNPANSSYEGNVSLLGLNQGDTLLLTVTATDYFGNQNSATRLFIYDAPPELILESPLHETVARPNINVKFKCIDKDSCNVFMYFNSTLVGYLDKVKDSAELLINLSSFNSQSGDFKILAYDKKSQGQQYIITVHVETNAQLQDFKNADSKIFDFNYNKLLLRGGVIGLAYPKIFDVTTNLISTIPFKIDLSNNSYVTPFGALLSGVDSSLYPQNSYKMAYDWNNNSITPLGNLNSSSSLVNKGNFAIWNNASTLYLRDLATRTNTTVSTNAANSGNDVTASGKVGYFTNDYNIFTFKNGTSTPITNPAENYSSTSPLLDEKFIVYRRMFKAAQQPNLIWMFDGQTNTQLSEIGLTFPSANSHYQVNNGYIAFVRLGTSGQTQVWLRDSSGVETQKTFFNTSSTIHYLSPNGDVVYINTGTNNSKTRYLHLKNGTILKISPLGEVYFRDSSFYTVIGRSLFKITTDANIKLCPNGSTTLNALLTGGNFQWQVNSGSGFTNVVNDANYAGATSSTLTITNAPATLSKYQYRLTSANGISNVFVLNFTNYWKGGSARTWEDPANWMCGTVPDANTDVQIDGGTVIINSNVIVRSLQLAPGASLIVRPGYQLTVRF